MKDLFSRFLVLAVALTGAQALRAAQSDWYQVELLIVEQPAAGGAGGEAWPPYPTLGYPEDGRFLVAPGQLQERLQAHPGALASKLDARGRQVLQLPPLTAAYQAPRQLPEAADIPPAAEGTLSDEMPVSSGASATPEQPGTVEDESGNDTASSDEDQEPPRLPVSHALLPASEHEFRGKAAYMARNGGYRILFHERWWQPIPEGQTLRPIILDHSGDGGSWPRLQGSISLSRSRFLHLSTRLWLNTDGESFPENWRMPSPPRGPASLLLDRTDARALTWLLAPGVLPPAVDRQLFPPLPARAEPPEWPWQHAITLEQQRRMRSGEVHYLDHPRLGLIIKLTPLERETLESADYDRDWHHLTTGAPLRETTGEAFREPSAVTPAVP